MNTSTPTPHHLLVVLGRSAQGHELRSRLAASAAGKHLQLRVLAPAFADSRLRYLASDVDPGIRKARDRLTETIAALGPPADGEIGEADPVMAIDTALVDFPAEEIVIIPSARRRQWAEAGLSEHVRARFDLPVREIELREDAA